MAANVNSSIAYYPNNGFVPNSVLRANSGSPVVGYATPGNLTPGRCSTPVPSGRCSTPVSLGRCSTPVSSGRCSTPVSSGRCSTPVSSGRCSTPVSFVTRKYYADIIAASTASTVAIDNKIEQAMDLVKSHLMFAVREEVDVLKDRIVELMDRIKHLECENTILRQYASPEVLQQLQSQMPHQMQQPAHHSSTS